MDGAVLTELGTSGHHPHAGGGLFFGKESLALPSKAAPVLSIWSESTDSNNYLKD
ncbi:hypothetical protein D3C75_1296260 [compost metagenome]